jgi:uncharacterized protein YukE
MTDPMSARIAVPPELETTGPAIMAIANQIGDELNQLARLLAPLREYWTGRANVGWAELQTIWNTAATDLLSSAGTLGAISHATTVNWNNYVDAENANVHTWSH